MPRADFRGPLSLRGKHLVCVAISLTSVNVFHCPSEVACKAMRTEMGMVVPEGCLVFKRQVHRDVCERKGLRVPEELFEFQWERVASGGGDQHLLFWVRAKSSSQLQERVQVKEAPAFAKRLAEVENEAFLFSFFSSLEFAEKVFSASSCFRGKKWEEEGR